jgi:hypothetical protein
VPYVPQWYEDKTHLSYWTWGALARRVFWWNPLLFLFIIAVLIAAVVIAVAELVVR